MIALVRATGIPGLVDVELPDGTVHRDLTRGQLEALAVREGWTLVPAEQRPDSAG